MFTTLADVIDQVTLSLGEYAADHDVEEIARRISTFEGIGFTVEEDPEVFWTVVADCAIN